MLPCISLRPTRNLKRAFSNGCLLGLAPDGVYTAANVIVYAVSSYLAISPLPAEAFPLLQAVYFLLHFPSPCDAWVLPSILALWCSDFPHRLPAGRPARLLVPLLFSLKHSFCYAICCDVTRIIQYFSSTVKYSLWKWSQPKIFLPLLGFIESSRATMIRPSVAGLDICRHMVLHNAFQGNVVLPMKA